MQAKDLMQNPNNGKLLVTTAKIDGKVYQGYLNEGYIKIGTISGFDISVKGLVKDEVEHNKICDEAIKQLIKDVENNDVAILGDWLSRLPTNLLKIFIS